MNKTDNNFQRPSSRYRRWLPLLTLALLLIIVTTVYAAWSTAVIVDNSENVGNFASMAVVSGNPAIAYYDVTNTDLKYAFATHPTGSS